MSGPPLGDYNPDWAVVVEQDEKLYLVRETKGTLARDKRRESKNKKVNCGKDHFKALGMNFKDAASIHEVLQGLTWLKYSCPSLTSRPSSSTTARPGWSGWQP